MGRTRDVSKILTSNTSILTLASASTIYATKSSTGLVLLNTNNFSGVSTFSLPNNTFTSTYDSYLMVVNVTSNSDDAQVRLRVRATETDLTSGSYVYAFNSFRSSNASNSAGATSQTSILFGELETNFAGRCGYKIEFIGPKLLDKTKIIFQSQDSDQASVYSSRAGGGLVNNDLSYDSATIFVSSGTFTGTYSVYGYNK